MHKAGPTAAQDELGIFIQELQILPSDGRATTGGRVKENFYQIFLVEGVEYFLLP